MSAPRRSARRWPPKGLGEVIIAGLLSNNIAFILQGGLVTGLMAILLYDAMVALERRWCRTTHVD